MFRVEPPHPSSHLPSHPLGAAVANRTGGRQSEDVTSGTGGHLGRWPSLGVAAGGSDPPRRVALAGRRPAGLRPLPSRLHQLAVRRAASPRGRGVVEPRFHPRRWMMFPEGHGLRPGHPDLRGYVRFVNLDTGALVRARLPLFADHRAIDSVDGLLVLLRDRDSAVRLLHPFTGDVVELPPLATLLPQLAARQTSPGPLPSIEKLSRVVCASASFSAGAVTVLLALHQVSFVAFASAMDQQWTLSNWRYEMPSRALSSRGKLYVAHVAIFSDDVQIFQIEPPVKDGMDSGSALQPPKLIATLPKGNLVHPIYMVECDSEILVFGNNDYWKRPQFIVFKLADLVQQRCIQITSIGGNILLA